MTLQSTEPYAAARPRPLVAFVAHDDPTGMGRAVVRGFLERTFVDYPDMRPPA